MAVPIPHFAVPDLTVTAVVDIVVVGFLIYQALMIVRGTRAGHIMVGILMMVLLYMAAEWGRLEVLRTLLSYIVPYTALAVIVLFQSEIRRTLARIGRKRWFASGFRRPESSDDILLALNRLSQEKTGALIVMERDIGLRTFVESGVRLDAHVSRDLLLSIFKFGSAMHDGAVIVQKDRVAAAACFLPLTVSPKLSKDLGSRHRAAIGLTEENDAVAIVISEQSGRISIVVDGEIERDLDADALRTRLRALVIQRAAAARKPEVQYT
jgi:diadenylate cyclase